MNNLAASPFAEATNALARLESDPALAPYRPHLLHALASRRQRRRDSEYERPDWPKTIRSLSNGAPDTVSDLHALVVEHLHGLAHRIANANTDIYKQFWTSMGMRS
jgi:hypothetical protein